MSECESSEFSSCLVLMFDWVEEYDFADSGCGRCLFIFFRVGHCGGYEDCDFVDDEM